MSLPQQDTLFSHLCPCKIGCQPMKEISILHDHKTGYSENHYILHLCNSKTPSKVKRHILTSLKVNDVITIASCHNIGKVVLTAQEHSRILFAFYNLTNTPILFSSL